jgi:uncharacterized protein
MSYRPYKKPGLNPVWVLIGVTVVIYLATILNPEAISASFGLTPLTVQHEPWTLFTYMFVHASVTHIIFNMLTLYFFGTFAMALIGETQFLLTYFAGGIVGGILYFLLSFPLHYEFTTVVGASGAVYALGGLLMVMRPKTRVMVFPIPAEIPLWIAILVGFLLVTIIPNVAWEAHLGGLIYGAAIGYFFRRKEMRRY